ncbi:MAG: hypothetical protein ACE37M_06005 [Henriciella sp.]
MKLLGKSACCALVALGGGLSISAQDMRSASEKVVACQTVEDATERLACFEAAATELSTLLTTPAPVQSAAVKPEAPIIPAAPAESTAAPTTTDAAQAPIQQASAATEESGEVPRSRLPSWIPRITFGSDRDVEKEPDEFQTKLTRVQVNRIGRHFFTTEEGHVWEQKTPDEIRAPKSLPADVILYQNITGGLRLKIVETNRSYAVQRVE